MSYTKTKVFENGTSTKSAIAIPAWAQQMIDNGGELNTAIDAYNKTPQLYRAVQMRANALASIPFVVSRGNKPISWMYPQSLPKLLFEMEAAMLVSGAAYLLKLQPASGGNRTVGLQVLSPTSMSVAYDARSKQVLFTQQVRNERFGPWTADRLVYMREFSFTDEVGAGLAPAKVALPAASLRMSMNEFARGFFSSGGQPLTLLSMQGNPPPTEIERTEKFFKRTMAGVRNAWRVLAVRSEVTVTPITPELGTMAMEELQTVTTREIASAFGIPLSLLTSDSANYATAQSDQRLFYDNTIRARLLMYETALNEQLLNEIQSTIKFIPESLSVYQEDEAERSGALVNLVNAGMQLRDAMLILGYSIEEVTGLTATEPTISNATSDTKKKTFADFSLTDEALEDYANIAHYEQVRSELKAWQRVAAKSRERAIVFECNAIPPEHEKSIRQHLQSEQPLLQHVFEEVPIKSLRLQTKAEKAIATQIKKVFESYKKSITREAAQGKTDSTNIDAMCKALGTKVAPILANVYSTTISAAITGTGLEINTDRYKNLASEWAENYTFNQLTGELQTTTINNVQRMVSKLLADPSLNAMQVAAGLFPTFSDYRVAMIAITEVTRAKSAAINGAYNGLSEDGFDVVRRWGTRLDEKVCFICGPLDNKKEATYKKQFIAGPPAHPNCRCFIGVEVKAENTEEQRDSVPQAIPKPVAPKPVTPKPVIAPKPATPVAPVAGAIQTGTEILAAVRELAARNPDRENVKQLRAEVEAARIAFETIKKTPLRKRKDFPNKAAFEMANDKFYAQALKLQSDYKLAQLLFGSANQWMKTEVNKLLTFADAVPIELRSMPSTGNFMITPREKAVVKTVSGWINPDIVPNKNSFGTQLVQIPREGSYYAPPPRRNGTFINLSNGYDDSTLVHELGHFLDSETQAFSRQTQAKTDTKMFTAEFAKARNAGYRQESLQREYPALKYKLADSFYRDKWRDVYTGRRYDDIDTEVLSNGFMYLWEDAEGFADFDPEHFARTVNLIRGIVP